MLTLRSPAKINVFLRIIRRRSDGFHELASLFQTVSLYDTITIQRSSASDVFTCSDSSIPVDGRNLVSKALNLFRSKTGRNDPVAISLHKCIPVEAGLGGGSSNAATTLWGLNQLYGGLVSIEELKEWGAELGSDVAFFLSTGTAYCQGRGELIEELAPLSISSKCVLVKPSFGMSTADVYKHLDLNLLGDRDPRLDLLNVTSGTPVYYNDLEVSAFALNPDLLGFKKLLHADHVVLSGSGSTFFCIGDIIEYPINAWCSPVSFVNRTKSTWY